ncbi:hypothetical protein [Microbispora triticiradicis]|uniref:Uncharacterized protein n=2 Tax=Microbispora TaxID=2005 RepID=A0ABY3LX52_9ACTN|nr:MULTISPECIES: hypothetical protein [Microbispora]TLP66146.1 hypothetical protein FED44_01095 [Microbispora fusca]TYB58448.1 hypothetical protein FXF59_16545 [Microbispora tritici]
MSIELAVALGAIATKAAVTALLQQGAWDDANWAIVAHQVIDAVVGVRNRPDAGVQRIGQRLDVLERQIAAVGRKVELIPVREFDEHMAAGRRYMRDLRDQWRTAYDRYALVERAQHEFVRAFGIAENMKDASRQALADTAIAGCWLWVPSMPDVIKTIGQARLILEQELLFGATLPTSSYADVVRLCRAYGECPAWTGNPVVPASGPPTPGARVAVRAEYNRWTRCAGVDMRVNPAGDDGARQRAVTTRGGPVIPVVTAPGPQERVTIELHNRRADWISVSVTADAVVVRLPQHNKLPGQNRVAPGSSASLTLPRPGFSASFSPYGSPSGLPSDQYFASPRNGLASNTSPIPPIPAIGFVLPQRSRRLQAAPPPSTPRIPPPRRNQRTSWWQSALDWVEENW